jgi:hypothetical protein
MEDTPITPPAIDKLATALAKAQAKFKNPPKNRTVKVNHLKGGSHSYSYATLDEVLDAVRGPLSENGIAFIQLVTMRDGVNVLVTKLIHQSGQEIESVYRLPEGLGIQEFGAAITYARRYTACPLLGIAGETDTDGEEAQAAQEQVDQTKKQLAMENLKKAATEGRLTNAHTGEQMQAADIKPDGKVDTKPKEAPKQPPDDMPMDFPINEQLKAKLTESGISVAQFKAWGVAKGNFPETMDMSKLESGFVAAVLKNWPKVLAAIKK